MMAEIARELAINAKEHQEAYLALSNKLDKFENFALMSFSAFISEIILQFTKK